MKLDRSKSYLVKRVGKTSDRVTQGKYYVANYIRGYQDEYCWTIENTDKEGIRTSPSLQSSVWKILHDVPKGYSPYMENYEGELVTNDSNNGTLTYIDKSKGIAMNNEFQEIKSGRIINGQDASLFGDAEIISFIKQETKKLDTLRDDVGIESKYYREKAAEISVNIVDLTLELDSRV